MKKLNLFLVLALLYSQTQNANFDTTTIAFSTTAVAAVAVLHWSFQRQQNIQLTQTNKDLNDTVCNLQNENNILQEKLNKVSLTIPTPPALPARTPSMQPEQIALPTESTSAPVPTQNLLEQIREGTKLKTLSSDDKPVSTANSTSSISNENMIGRVLKNKFENANGETENYNPEDWN